MLKRSKLQKLGSLMLLLAGGTIAKSRAIGCDELESISLDFNTCSVDGVALRHPVKDLEKAWGPPNKTTEKKGAGDSNLAMLDYGGDRWITVQIKDGVVAGYDVTLHRVQGNQILRPLISPVVYGATRAEVETILGPGEESTVNGPWTWVFNSKACCVVIDFFEEANGSEPGAVLLRMNALDLDKDGSLVPAGWRCGARGTDLNPNPTSRSERSTSERKRP